MTFCYLYFWGLCLQVITEREWMFHLGAHVQLKPPSLDLFIGIWTFVLTTREHGAECEDAVREQLECAA